MESSLTPENAKDTDTQFDRLFDAAGCRTQAELADLLGIRQSSIAVAKRRNRLPSEWLLKILRLRNVNPDWIIFGSVAKYLLPYETPGSDAEKLQRETPPPMLLDGLIMHRILGCFRAKDLQHELVRRKKIGPRFTGSNDQRA